MQPPKRKSQDREKAAKIENQKSSGL